MAWSMSESAKPVSTILPLLPIPPSKPSTAITPRAPIMASPARHQNVGTPSAKSGRTNTVPATSLT